MTATTTSGDISAQKLEGAYVGSPVESVGDPREIERAAETPLVEGIRLIHYSIAVGVKYVGRDQVVVARVDGVAAGQQGVRQRRTAVVSQVGVEMGHRTDPAWETGVVAEVVAAAGGANLVFQVLW